MNETEEVIKKMEEQQISNDEKVKAEIRREIRWFNPKKIKKLAKCSGATFTLVLMTFLSPAVKVRAYSDDRFQSDDLVRKKEFIIEKIDKYIPEDTSEGIRERFGRIEEFVSAATSLEEIESIYQIIQTIEYRELLSDIEILRELESMLNRNHNFRSNPECCRIS